MWCEPGAGTAWAGLPHGVAPLAKQLQDAGYDTDGFPVNGYPSRDWGYDTGFDSYLSIAEKSSHDCVVRTIGNAARDALDSQVLDKYLFEPARYWLIKQRADGEDGDETHDLDHTDRDTVDAALEWLDGRDRDTPYFLWVHFMDAHTPYGYWPEHLAGLGADIGDDYTPRPDNDGLITEGQSPPQTVIDIYDSCIREVDEQVGRILDRVGDESTVILTGNHGEGSGDHLPFQTGSFYPTMTGVPIIVRSPHVASGRHSEPVQHLDTPATIHRVASVDQPERYEGTALTDGDSEPLTDNRKIFFSLRESDVAVREGETLVERVSGDTSAWEWNSLTTKRRLKLDRASDLVEELDGYISFIESNRVGSTGLSGEHDTSLSDETEESLRNLGYID